MTARPRESGEGFAGACLLTIGSEGEDVLRRRGVPETERVDDGLSLMSGTPFPEEREDLEWDGWPGRAEEAATRWRIRKASQRSMQLPAKASKGKQGLTWHDTRYGFTSLLGSSLSLLRCQFLRAPSKPQARSLNTRHLQREARNTYPRLVGNPPPPKQSGENDNQHPSNCSPYNRSHWNMDFRRDGGRLRRGYCCENGDDFTLNQSRGKSRRWGRRDGWRENFEVGP